jgi:hypothetical protein
MLNRKLCEKCRNKTWPDGHDVQGECDWVCPKNRFGSSVDFIRIDFYPPNNCDYKFEHAVSEGSVNIDSREESNA